jgi:DNA-binding transcriptional regulator YiaG
MKIKEMRKATHLTQTEFGNYFNIPMRTIQDWEAEKHKCPEYVLELIEYKLVNENMLKNDE